MLGTAHSLVIVHDPLPLATLFCVDLEKREVIWIQKLWCDNAPYVRSGGGFTHISETLVREDLICVFGACNDVAYIEGFRLADGKAEFRFSTTYGWTIPSDNRAGVGSTD
jgi:hypothetical protein